MRKIHEDDNRRKFRPTTTQMITLGFLAAILIGTGLLMLPFATVSGEETSVLTALFTATTSICVTGLVVVDTYAHWTLFGQIIILLMIQIGGFGVITLYSLLMIALKKRFSLKTRVLIQDYYNLDSIHGLIKFLLKVVKGTLIVEGIGAILYAVVFVPEFGLRGIWIAIFNAISAFCNAGMDVIGNRSLIPYQSNLLINLLTMGLIILGGLGFVVWFDLGDQIKAWKVRKGNPFRILKRLGVHTKLVLWLTLFLILTGAALVLIFEWDNPQTLGELPVGQKILAAFFQSVTFRTAGFATIPQEGLTSSTCLLGCIYMFIGGSPVGTAGGIKTVTICVIVMNVISFIRNRTETVVLDRSVSLKLINKANAIATVHLAMTLILTIALMQTAKVPLMSALYEMFSATGTVGLSRGLTATLSNAGRVLVIIGMFLGRIGPISMAVFFNVGRSDQNDLKYASGHFIVG